MPPPIAAPRDIAYPGQIRLQVDVSDVTRRIDQVRETIPVSGPGPMVLLYPKWLPGNHSPERPAGPARRPGDHRQTASAWSGRAIRWTSTPSTSTCRPARVSLELRYQYLTPTEDRVGRVMATPEMLNLEWNTVALYPAGYFSRDITYRPSVTLPAGWKFGSALDGASRAGDTVSFAPVTLNTLVDSPLLLAGATSGR